MDNMNFEQLRQMGMAPSRQIDMAPLNIPGVARTPMPAQQGINNIDTRIGELENMFANVHTNRAFSQQEMQDMNQKRQLLDNLYRIRDSSQSRALADEERKQKIEALRQMGEKAKEDKRNAQLAKAKEIPSTFVSERMGQNPYVPAGAGTFIDSQGRTAAVPKYGTVTPAMYGALGESRLKGTAAPTAQDFQPKETPYTITENRINEAIKLNDYGKASMLAQQQINNLAQIAAMPGLSEEAKQVLNANMISLANQAKSNAGIYQEQVKAKALVQKQPLKAVETEPKNAKLSLDEKKQLANIYKDVYDQKIKIPVGKNYEGNIVYQEKPLFLLSADEVQLALRGEKTGTTGKDIAKRQYEERAKLILPDTITEIPENVQNAPQGTQVNTPEEKRSRVLNLYNSLMTDPKNPNVMYDPKEALAWLDTAQGENYVQSKGLSDDDIEVLKDAILKTTSAKDNSGIEYINRKYQPRNQGAGVSVGKTETKKKAGENKKTTNNVVVNTPVTPPSPRLYSAENPMIDLAPAFNPSSYNTSSYGTYDMRNY